MQKVFVTSGAGFIGSALIRFLINETNHSVVNLDKLTYAGNLESLQSIAQSQRYRFVQLDICDKESSQYELTTPIRGEYVYTTDESSRLGSLSLYYSITELEIEKFFEGINKLFLATNIGAPS